MLDICFFIQDYGRKQINEQSKEDQKNKKSRKRLNNASVDQLMEQVQQEEAKAGGEEPAQAQIQQPEAAENGEGGDILMNEEQKENAPAEEAKQE